jgi:hypothetical protein
MSSHGYQPNPYSACLVSAVSLTSSTGVPCSISGGVSPIDLSRAACSSLTCGSGSMFGPLILGSAGVVAGCLEEALSLAARCCRRPGANLFCGIEGLVLNATDRAVKRCNRGGIVAVCIS